MTVSLKANTPIAILGAGSWGTALGITLAKNGNEVRLWGHNPAAIAEIAQKRCNTRYLPDIELPDNLLPLNDIVTVLDRVQDVLIAVPSHGFKQTLELIKPFAGSLRICSATKGLEPGTGRLLTAVIQELLGSSTPLAILSGPSFAFEVAKGLPTAITLAANNDAFAAALIARFHSQTFRVYRNPDLIGVQLGGAIKNILAIAAGISDGLGFGANARSALITRGLAELVRLGTALGGKLETFMGLAGMGDLVLTCTDNLSRNRRFGLALGEGNSPAAAEAAIGQVVEGAKNAKEVYHLAVQQQIEMPITEQVYNILYHNISAREAVINLLSREPKVEL